MIILVGLGIVLAVGIVLWVSFIDECNGAEIAGGIMTIISSILLVGALIGLPLQRAETQRFLRQYSMIRTENDRARIEGDVIERAALRTQINDYNSQLVTYQFWNDTIFDIYVPDEVMSIELIR